MIILITCLIISAPPPLVNYYICQYDSSSYYSYLFMWFNKKFRFVVLVSSTRVVVFGI